jgi:lysophospholipase L1-like esterase
MDSDSTGEWAPGPGTTRLMVVGDSLSQGSAGDFTWRYWLWRHLEESGAMVDLVGPRDDLYENVAGRFGNQDYLDPNFDRDHAAVWGGSLGVATTQVAEQVVTQEPDVLVVLLGLNDLSWRGSTPPALEQSMRTLVAQARDARPDVALVLTTVPVTDLPGVPAYNGRLRDIADELSTGRSPVVVAEAQREFSPREDTWDAVHPNARGEVKIAAAVSDALSRLGLGPPYARPVPALPLGPRRAPFLTALPGDGAVTLSWLGPPGATGEYVWVRDTTAGEAWTQLPIQVPGNTWVVGALVNDHAYEFMLQPVKGMWAAEPDVRSNPVEAVPRSGGPPAPTGLEASVRGRSVGLSWDPVAGATGYRVLQRFSLESGWSVVDSLAPRPARRVEGLRAGASYDFAVQALAGEVAGPLSPPAQVTLPGSLVPLPRG